MVWDRLTDPRGVWVRGLGAIAGVVYLALVAKLLVGARIAVDGSLPLVAIAAALAPVLVFFGLKYPLIFPFGVYLVLIPFDNILVAREGATITRFAAILSAAALGFNMLVTRRINAPPRAWYSWLFLVAWMGLTVIWTVAPTPSNLVFSQVLQLFLLMTLLAFYPARRKELVGLAVVMILSGVAAAGYGLQQFYAGQLVESRLTLQNANGLSVDPNYLASSFLLPISMCLLGVLFTKPAGIRILCGLAVCPMIIGVLITGSRGGFFALIATVLVFAWRSKQRHWLLGLVAVGFVASLFYPLLWQRFNDPTQGAGSGRLFIWSVGVEALKSHFVGGAGVGAFGAIYDQFLLQVYQHQFQGWSRPSHNMVLGTLVEIGVIGFALAMWSWWTTFRQLRKIPKTSSLHPFRVAIEASLVGLFVAAMFTDPFQIKYYWFAFSLVLIVQNVYEPQPLLTTADLHGESAHERLSVVGSPGGVTHS